MSVFVRWHITKLPINQARGYMLCRFVYHPVTIVGVVLVGVVPEVEKRVFLNVGCVVFEI